MSTYINVPSFNLGKEDLVASNIVYFTQQGLESNVQTAIDILAEAVIAAGAKIYYDTTENWNQKPQLVSEKGSLYIYSDRYSLDSTDIPAMKVGDGVSLVTNLPFTDEVLQDGIDSLFTPDNYIIVEGGTIDDSQKELVSKSQPIEINSKLYYYSTEDNNTYYYFNSDSSNGKIFTNIIKISKSNWKCSFLTKEVGEAKQEIVFSTFAEFPTIGEENMLYVDKRSQLSYIWDPDSASYKSMIIESDKYTIQSIL